MTILQKGLSLVLFSLVFTGSAIAQAAPTEHTPVSDSELKQFASAYQSIQEINQEAQMEMVSAIENEGMEVQRYSEIQQAQQNPAVETEVTDAETRSFENVSMVIQKIQTEAQENMIQTIEDTGLTIQRYQELAQVIQSDPELTQKLHAIIEG